MKNIFFLILIFLLGCSGGGGGGGSAVSIPKLDSNVENEFSKTKDITPEDFLTILNSIPVLKEKGSFSSISNLEFKQGAISCVGNTKLNIIYDKDLKLSSVSRTTKKISGSCNGNTMSKNYQTNRDLNLNFLYKVAKVAIISEGDFSGKRAFLLSIKEKDQTTIYLLSVNGNSFESLKSVFNYLNDDGYIKINTTISPSTGTKIDGNLIEDTPETGDIIELSEFPLYDLIG